MLGEQTKAVEFGKKVIKGANHHERLAASRSLFRPMPGAPERHYDAALFHLRGPLPGRIQPCADLE